MSRHNIVSIMPEGKMVIEVALGDEEALGPVRERGSLIKSESENLRCSVQLHHRS
jgi:hypothetical protein